MKKITIKTAIATAVLAGLTACKTTHQTQDNSTTIEQTVSSEFKLNYEKFVLDNGLEVILHKDSSDPVAAVALTFHVGSAREKEGRTGFAHLFEHLLFLESENLGKGGLDKLNSRVGGSGANGSTSRDRTNYFQTVPNDALEKMLWAEADKLGYFINTVTDQVLAKEKQVVKNEKRLRVDNVPYGHVNYVIGKSLYPDNHPYNWQVIGSLEDLQNSTLEDVKEFYKKWYVPNNATLVVAGDFDTAQAKQWIKKYFSEIKRGDEINDLEVNIPELAENKALYYEDNFAKLPQLRLAWPTAEIYHQDYYALNVLANYLAQGKGAPLYRILTEKHQLAANPTAFSFGSEISGEFYINVNAYEGKALQEVKDAVFEALHLFEKEGISQKDLNRIKAGQETQFYQTSSSVIGKAFQLAQFNIFADDPGYINQNIKNILAVTQQDVMRVYNQYIKGKHYISTSFVPKGQTDLVVTGAKLAEVEEEKIVKGAEQQFDLNQEVSYQRTPSSFDRSKEPEYGKEPQIKVPEIWEKTLTNGLEVHGIIDNEVPLVNARLRLKGGQLLDDPNKVGVAYLFGQLMNKGTKNKTTEQLENAIQELGSTITFVTGRDNVQVNISSLSKHYAQTMQLVEEMLLEPRWDQQEFELIKKQTKNNLIQQASQPGTIAANQLNQLIFGDEHILSKNLLGDAKTIDSISIDDLKAYYSKNMSPSVADFYIVGAVDSKKAVAPMKALEKNWLATPVSFIDYKMPERTNSAKVYFYDVPGAKQSVINMANIAMPSTADDYYAASRIMNYKLGGGGFASKLTQELREGKGYTYGIGSGFVATPDYGYFNIGTNVRTNVTYESLVLIRDIMKNYGKDFSDADLNDTQSFLIKSNARAFETHQAKLAMLQNINENNLPRNFLDEQLEEVKTISKQELAKLAIQYANPDKMIYLIVGDAKTQLKEVEKLDLGEISILN